MLHIIAAVNHICVCLWEKQGFPLSLLRVSFDKINHFQRKMQDEKT